MIEPDEIARNLISTTFDLYDSQKRGYLSLHECRRLLADAFSSHGSVPSGVDVEEALIDFISNIGENDKITKVQLINAIKPIILQLFNKD